LIGRAQDATRGAREDEVEVGRVLRGEVEREGVRAYFARVRASVRSPWVAVRRSVLLCLTKVALRRVERTEGTAPGAAAAVAVEQEGEAVLRELLDEEDALVARGYLWVTERLVLTLLQRGASDNRIARLVNVRLGAWFEARRHVLRQARMAARDASLGGDVRERRAAHQTLARQEVESAMIAFDIVCAAVRMAPAPDFRDTSPPMEPLYERFVTGHATVADTPVQLLEVPMLQGLFDALSSRVNPSARLAVLHLLLAHMDSVYETSRHSVFLRSLLEGRSPTLAYYVACHMISKLEEEQPELYRRSLAHLLEEARRTNDPELVTNPYLQLRALNLI
jgi:hypothetical protein